MDVRGKFGDSRSNHSQDIQATHFVMEQRRRDQTLFNRHNALWHFAKKCTVKPYILVNYVHNLYTKTQIFLQSMGCG